MTETLYLTDPYETTIEATVERVTDNRVALDQTIFYPTGGGQLHDTGSMTSNDEEWEVVDVQKKDVIYHELDRSPPTESTTVTCHLDWSRRYTQMRAHTAQHLLSAHLLEEYDAPTRGNQLGLMESRLDCAYSRFEEPQLQHIEERLNELIAADLPVRWYTMDRETAEAELDQERTRLELLPDSITNVRIVEIADFDRTACAGTHVEATGEIGEITVTGRETAGDGRERIRFELD